MRLRLPELLEARGMTAYALAKASSGRISLSTIYRLVRQKGRARYIDAEVAEALCSVLGIGPAELFELDGPPAHGADSRRKTTRARERAAGRKPRGH